MQRVKRTTAVAVMPAAPAGGTPGYFAAPNPSGGVPATVPGYEWFNAVQEELVAIITAAGLTPDGASTNQVLTALRSGTLLGAAASGTADALTATFTTAIPALVNGMTLHVRPGAANATATPTFSPSGLAAKTIVKGAGAALAVGDIAGAGHWLTLQYDSTMDKWVLLNPATGVQVYASSAEAQAFAVANKAISPSTLAAAFQGGNQSLSSSGYQKLPGGLILQWVSASGLGDPGTITGSLTWPLAFPTACFLPFLACADTTGWGGVSATVTSYSLTGVSYTVRDPIGGTNNVGIYAIALGK